jgi:BolA protein
MREVVEEKLSKNLNCESLEIINESHLHAGHHHVDGEKGTTTFDGKGETHFRIKIKSSDFSDMTRVNIHKKIYEIISDEMKIIHALAIEVQK